MPKKAENPFKMGYNPELDTSPELDSDSVLYYLTIIGILKWTIELERIDVITKVALLSSGLGVGDIWRQQCISWPMLIRDTIPDWCMIVHTLR